MASGLATALATIPPAPMRTQKPAPHTMRDWIGHSAEMALINSGEPRTELTRPFSIAPAFSAVIAVIDESLTAFCTMPPTIEVTMEMMGFMGIASGWDSLGKSQWNRMKAAIAAMTAKAMSAPISEKPAGVAGFGAGGSEAGTSGGGGF